MSLGPFATLKARPARVGALARLATTGIYLLRGIPRELQRVVRARALAEGTTVHSVLLRALREYAAKTWTPRPEEDPPRAEDLRPS
jgi:hypothetical protein